MLVIIYCILVAAFFYQTAKTRGLSSAKWGAIGFFGSLASYFVGAMIIIAFVQVGLIGERIVRAPGYFLFPASALVMYLVYRKWIYRMPKAVSREEP